MCVYDKNKHSVLLTSEIFSQCTEGERKQEEAAPAGPGAASVAVGSWSSLRLATRGRSCTLLHFPPLLCSALSSSSDFNQLQLCPKLLMENVVMNSFPFISG